MLHSNLLHYENTYGSELRKNLNGKYIDLRFHIVLPTKQNLKMG